MKKILAVLLAAAMLFALAACGDNTAEETTTTTAAEEITEAPIEETTEAPVEDTSAADATEAPSEAASEATSEEATTEAAADVEMTKADFVAFLNAETAKAVKGSYKYSRTCSYTDPIDVGNATDTLNGIISSIDKNSNLDTVVGGFLGIGTKEGSFPKDQPDDDYKLKATSLKEADLGSFSYADGVYSFTLANATEPLKNGATPISRFTNDFITHQEVADGVAEQAGSLIKVEDTNVNYTNIKVSVKVDGGKIVEVKYSYNFDATLDLKATFVPIHGDGAAKTTGAFTNIKY